MTKTILASFFLFTALAATLALAATSLDAPAPAPSPTPAPPPTTSCPDLSGHYQHKQLGASADAYVTQTGCTSIEVKVTASVLGQDYNEDVSSPLDGVMRQYPSPDPSPGEVDYASAEFKGSTVVVIIERDVTNNGQTTKSMNEAEAVLTSPNVLQITEGDLDSNGNLSGTHTFDFNRVQ